MPKLGESVHEGTIEQWLISVGDYVDEYEPLCEVITDKVTEVPSTVSGTITEILVSEGETVQIDHVICKIETSETDNSTNTKNTDIETVKDSTDLNINGNDTLTVETSKIDFKNTSDKEVSHSVKSNAHTQASLLNNGRYSPVVLKLHLKMILIYHQFLARVSKDV